MSKTVVGSFIISILAGVFVGFLVVYGVMAKQVAHRDSHGKVCCIGVCKCEDP